EEQKSTLNISVKIETDNQLTVQGNTMLTEILIQNLLKNAFLHNTENGTLTIRAEVKQLTITNTGHKKAGEGSMLDKEKLFNRFYKQSGISDSWGLGLSIAMKIADTSGWKLCYREEGGLHVFEVDFG
ncbi:MAG: two-component sensor histidine kinase, partial [Flavobacteriaceae bacterium]|nr:two-component sensor histidine kinase [Flavobacteriaceae bacterium]